jgi:hypothetical protein
MTCQELRSYYEDPMRVDTNFRVDSAEVAAHAADCADCGRFIEQQRDLGMGLRLVQECVAEPSTALDAVILANYREYVSKQPSSVGSTPSRRRPKSAALRWSAALAAVVLVAVILSSQGRKNVATIPQSSTAQSIAVPQPTDSNPRDSNLSAVMKREVSHATSSPVVRRRHPAPSVATLGNSLPVGFHSLMYCDELSCSGAMEMIRVQLPSSSAFTSPSGRTNDVVFADVLVGSDGIARGIRIVE